MRIKNILFAFFLTLISVSDVLADDPPCPSGDCDPGLGFPAMPIDHNIVYLMGAALVLGFVMIYRNKIKRASV